MILKEIIRVLQAFEDGQTLHYRSAASDQTVVQGQEDLLCLIDETRVWVADAKWRTNEERVVAALTRIRIEAEFVLKKAL